MDERNEMVKLGKWGGAICAALLEVVDGSEPLGERERCRKVSSPRTHQLVIDPSSFTGKLGRPACRTESDGDFCPIRDDIRP